MRELLIFMAWGMILSAFVVFAALKFGLTAGYGRYTNVARFGLNPQLAWFIQESPSFFIPLYFLFFGTSNSGHYLTRMFLLHYFNRVFIFPFRLRSKTASPLYIVFSAVFFCVYNGFMQGAWNGYYQPEEGELTIRHYIGSVLYFFGMYINHTADKILFNLRAPGETGYKIPTGWLYEHVSCPNYLGEIIEWTGYAIIAWNLPALAFAIFTAANIGPRALSHHA
uniref:S5A_REDUCTASE domain-containing protein n=1 Tax=Caenorhabditis tropicalis TaxID=1561998 RepID=A0A1I7US07_9PELO